MDPHTSVGVKAPFLSGQQSMEVLEQAVKDLGSLSKFQRSNGDTFMGNVVNGKPQGVGIMRYRENDPHGRLAYRGEFLDGQRHGIGIMWWSDGSSYEGQWQDNKPDGHGLETYPDGGVYSGQFRADSRHGLGAYACPDGQFFIGSWEAGVQHGRGLSKTAHSEVVTTYHNGEIKEAKPANEETKEQILEMQEELGQLLQQTEAVADKARTAAESVEVLNSVSTLLPEAVRPLSGKARLSPKLVEVPSTRDLLMAGASDPDPSDDFFDITRVASVRSLPPPKPPVVEAEDKATSQLFNSLRAPDSEFLSGNLGSFRSFNTAKGFGETISEAAPQFSSINLGSKTVRSSLDSMKATAVQHEEHSQTKRLFSSASAPDVTGIRSKTGLSVKNSVRDSPQEDKEGQETAKLFSSLRLSSAGLQGVRTSPLPSPQDMSKPLQSSSELQSVKAACVVDSENAEMKQLFNSLHATKSMSGNSQKLLLDDSDSAQSASDDDLSDAEPETRFLEKLEKQKKKKRGGRNAVPKRGNSDRPGDVHVFDRQTEAAVKIQSGLRGMMDRRRAGVLKQEEQHDVDTIAESDEGEDDSEGEEDDGGEWAATGGPRRSRRPVPVGSTPLQLIDEDSVDGDEQFVSLGSQVRAVGERRGMVKERVVMKLQPLSEDVDDADDEKEAGDDGFGRVVSAAGKLDKIEEQEDAEQRGDDKDEEMQRAAVKIQSGMRGMRDRNAVKALREQEGAESDIDVVVAEGSGLVSRVMDDLLLSLVDDDDDDDSKFDEEEAAQDEREAAVKIQSGLRGMRDRKQTEAMRREKTQAMEDEQRARQQREEEAAAEAAAIKIQSGMRGLRDRRTVRAKRHAAVEASEWPSAEVQALVDEGGEVLSLLPMEDAAHLVHTLQIESPSSPVAKVLLYELARPARVLHQDDDHAAEADHEQPTEVPKLPLDRLDADAAAAGSSLGRQSPSALQNLLTERSRQCLQSVIAEGRELMGRMEGLDGDLVGCLAEGVGTSPLASVLFYEATNILQRGQQDERTSAAGRDRNADRVLSQRTWSSLEELVAEGAQLLERLDLEDAHDVLRDVRTRAGASPLSTLLLDQLLSFRPRGIIRDPAAMSTALSARSQRNLADLVQAGRQLLGSLSAEDGAEILKSLHDNARTSPVAAALLYEVVCGPSPAVLSASDGNSAFAGERDLGQLTERTRDALNDFVREGQQLGRRLNEEQAESLLSTLREWSGTNTIAAAVTYEMLTHQPARARPESANQARRTMSARSRRQLQELSAEGRELIGRLGGVGDQELVRMLPGMAPSNPLAAVLYSELVTSWFRDGGPQTTGLEDAQAMRRALSDRSSRRLTELMDQGRTLMDTLDPSTTESLLETLLSTESPIAAVLRAEILAGSLHGEGQAETEMEAGAPDVDDAGNSGGLLSARTRERIGELMGECGKLLASTGEGSADALLQEIREQAGKNPLSTVLYNALLWSLTGRAKEGAAGADGWQDFAGLVKGVSVDAREEVAQLVTQSSHLMDALGQGGAQSVLEIVRSQQGSSPLATVMYNRVLEGLAEWVDEAAEAERAAQADAERREREFEAAFRIQNAIRGAIARKEMAQRARGAAAAAKVRAEQERAERERAEQEHAERERAEQERAREREQVEQERLAEAVRLELEERARKELAERQQSAAVEIQCSLRCMSARRQLRARREEAAAAEEEDPVDPFWFVDTMADELRSEVHTYLFRKRTEEGSPLLVIAQKLKARKIDAHQACIQTELLLLPVRWRSLRATSIALAALPVTILRERFKRARRAAAVVVAGLHTRGLRRFKANAMVRSRVAWKWAPKHRVHRESREYDESEAHALRRRGTFNAVREICLLRATQRDSDRETRLASGMPFRDVALIRRIQAERARQNFNKELVVHKQRVKLGRRRAPDEDKGQVALFAREHFGQAKTRKSAEVIQRRVRSHLARKATAEAMVRRDLRTIACRRLQKWARNALGRWNARLEMRDRIGVKEQQQVERAAALVVQGAYRGRLARLDRRFFARIVDKKLEEQERMAVVKTQAFFRKMLARKMVIRIKQNKLTRIDTNRPLHASLILQCAIRSHWARRHFHAVKDMVFFGFACRVAVRLQCWCRRMVAARSARKIAKSLLMMQQWSAAFAWRRTVTDLTRLAAAEWRPLLKYATDTVGHLAAFREAQTLAPAVMPSWWLGHFPVAFSTRVNLKASSLVVLEELLRQERIMALVGSCKFDRSLQLVSELIREVTAVHAEALDLSESYEALVSLLAFLNIHGCQLAASGEVSSQRAGHELLLFAAKLADGPNLSLEGMREKLEFRQWTHCNLARVFYLEGAYSKAAHHARLLASITTGEPGRDTVTAVTSSLYLASIQSKACKHNTAVATLEAASERLVKWCSEAEDPPPTWTTFCCGKDLMRRYHCSPSHLAAVCHYNLSVEFAARQQYESAVLAGRCAVALAAIDKLSEPLFHRRSVNTLAALEVIHEQPPSAAYWSLPEIVHRLQGLERSVQGDSTMRLSSQGGSRPGTSASSLLSTQETVRIYRPSQSGTLTPLVSPAPPTPKVDPLPETSPRAGSDEAATPLHVETSRRRFGLWFPPHVALRSKITLQSRNGTGDQPPPSAAIEDFPASAPRIRTTAFLRATPSLVETKQPDAPVLPSPKLGPVAGMDKRPMSGWQGKRSLLEAQLSAELLLLHAVPVQDSDMLEMLTMKGVTLKAEVLAESDPQVALKAVVNALRASSAHGSIVPTPSSTSLALTRDICTIAVLATSKFLALGQEAFSADLTAQAEKDLATRTMLAYTGTAERFARVASKTLFSGAHKGQLGDLKATVKMQTAMCHALQGDMDAAMFGMQELKRAFTGRPGRTQMLTVLSLNLATMLSKVDLHKEAFEACDDAWHLLRGMDEHADWACFSPGHSTEETTRVPWSMLCGFCKFQQAAQSLWMGFEGPALKLAQKSHALISQAASPASLPSDAELSTATEKVLQCIVDWSHAMATPPLLSRWIASVPPPPQEVTLVGSPVRVVKQLSGERALPPQRQQQRRSVRQKVKW